MQLRGTLRHAMRGVIAHRFTRAALEARPLQSGKGHTLAQCHITGCAAV